MILHAGQSRSRDAPPCNHAARRPRRSSNKKCTFDNVVLYNSTPVEDLNSLSKHDINDCKRATSRSKLVAYDYLQ
jgi:hypothetical protein